MLVQRILALLVCELVISVAQAEAPCSADIVKSYGEAKVKLASWSTAGASASDEETSSSCKAVLNLKPETCQLDCAKTPSPTLCPAKNGSSVSVKDLIEECKNFSRRGKTKST